MAVLEPATVVLLTVTALTAGIGVFAWRQRPRPGATTLAVLMAVNTVWTGSVIFAASVSGYWLSRIGVNLVITATGATTAAFFAFTLEYTGRERYLQWPYPLALAVEPALVGLLTFTNEAHGLFWTDVVPSATHYSGFAHEYSLGQQIHIVYTYVLTLVGIYLIVRKLLRSRAVHRTQTAAVLVGALAPIVGNALYVFDIFELGQILGFAVTGIALYWAIARGKLVDLTPVARATVLEDLEMGVIVLDERGRITDSNPYARRLLGIDDEADAIGSSIVTVFEDWQRLIREEGSPQGDEEIIEATIDGRQRLLRLTLSTLTDNLGREVGRLVLFEDVTDQQRRSEEIERQNERLEAFASMVSHDLRNPLDVASGYVELMRQDRTRTGEEMHLDVDKLDETADALERIETIVDDVLTLAREGEQATDPETVSLRSTARRAWEHVDTGDAQILVGTDAMVVADQAKLERLFENLFRNAVEHGSANPHSQAREDAVEHGSTSPRSRTHEDAVEHGDDGVHVSVGTVPGPDGPAGFYVADDGPGIPAAERDTVFESGYTTGDGGTGFGLAIVEQLSTAHDWTVRVAESEEGGARFEVTDVTFTTGGVPVEQRSERS